MSKKHLLLVAVIGLFNQFSALAQDTTALKKGADSLMILLQKEQFESYTKSIYPPVVEMAGGIEPYARLISNTKNAWKNAGFLTKEIVFDELSKVVQAGNEMHAILKYKASYTMQTNHFLGSIYLLAISNDQGTSWYYLDLESYDKDGIKDFVPNYNDELLYPVIEAPVLVEKD